MAAVGLILIGVTLWVTKAAPGTWPALALFVLAGVALAAIDVRHHLLPRRIVYPTLAATAFLVIVHCAITAQWAPLVTAAAGALTTAAFFYGIALITQGIGLGDVRLGLLTGLIAGWSGLVSILVALLLSTLLGALCGLGSYLLGRRTTARTRIPYGPAMIAGTLLAVWVQPPI